MTTRSRKEYVIGKASSLPEGTHMVVAVGAREYGVFNVRGTFHAIPNTCFHQGGPLCRGRLGSALVADEGTDWRPVWGQDGEVIACPWHGLEFNVTTGRSLAFPGRRLPTYEVLCEGDTLKLVL